MALIRHERIITTLPKARALRPFVEKLVTLAKKGTLHHRRIAIARLGPSGHAEVIPGDQDDADHRTIIQKLFDELGPRFIDRPGGYTRIIKRTERRLGDAGLTAYIEFLKEGETKTIAKEAMPEAPEIEEDEEDLEDDEDLEEDEEDTEDEEETSEGDEEEEASDEDEEEGDEEDKAPASPNAEETASEEEENDEEDEDKEKK